jgi:predicted RNA-binding Zn-ribbon protein involved in translation (DUF1610 family)
MKEPMQCRDCGGRLSTGFMVDSAYGSEQVGTWQEGEPQRRWWTLGGIVKAGAQRIEVTTYRCDECGLLSHYALGE